MPQNWYYSKDGKSKSGPITSAELRELARSGALQPSEMVQPEGSPKWQPASSIQNLFPEAPFNRADCPNCAAAVPLQASKRSFEQLKDEFVPWYKEKFEWAVKMESPWTYIVQVGLWYPGCGFIWIPIWFLISTKPLYTSLPATCPKCSHSFDALVEGKNLRIERFDWANAATIVAKVFMAIGAVVMLVIGSLALIFVASAVAAAGKCRHCGQPINPGYRVCAHCGLGQ